MRSLRALIRRVAHSDSTVLILGESGTGKELVAQSIHKLSPRNSHGFVPVNCGAIPADLLESELFGHTKGAFTGALTDRRGRFELAQSGTLFLDEIGDMRLDMQVKLLRVLQERSVRPVGASQPQPIDVRILSATHRDLEAALASGDFREDLFYRLNVVSITLPTLAERREDIPLLAQHFLQQLAAKHHRPDHRPDYRPVNGYAPEALRALATAAWPGNVRQLHNVVEQVCALATTPLIPLSLVQRALRTPSVAVLSYAQARHRFERDYLVGLLKLTDGVVSDAARLAERNRTEFYRLLHKHGLTAGRGRGQVEGDETDKADESGGAAG
jgi:two-component system response regulator GlrR